MNSNFWINKMPKYSIIIFICLNFVAIFLYPGGTLHNKDANYYLFTQNFFSDLGITISHSGENNFLSCILFNNSLIICGITFTMMFYKIKNIFENKILTYFATFFGICGGMSYIGVALTPSNLYLDEHIFFAHSIFRFLSIASLFYSIIIFKTKDFDNKYGYGFILFGIMIFLYVIVSELGPDPRTSHFALVLQAIAQKIIAFWILISIYIYSIGLGKYLENKID